MIYEVALIPRGNKKKPSSWTGPAINIIDAIQLAKESVFPDLHTANVISIREASNDEQEGDTR